MKKIDYYISHPIQYFSPLLKEMAKHFDLHVYYFSDSSVKGNLDKGFGQNVKWDLPLLDGYDYEFIKNYSRRNSLQNKLFDVFNPGVIRTLRYSTSSIIIVNGWSYSSTLMCILFGRFFKKKVWLRAENPLNQELQKGKLKLMIKSILLKHILFRFFIDKCLYIGKENKKFFEFYGVKAKDLIYTPYAVDNNYFKNQYKILRNSIDNIKVDFGQKIQNKIILFSGKYISKKRPLDLLKAFKSLNDSTCTLIMVGEGELRKKMEEYIIDNNLKNVLLTGFINQSEISRYYSIATVFVMCSGIGETWGLSVNEVMNFEKPIVVSSTCGSSFDLVSNGINGFTFEEGNIDEMVICLKKIVNDKQFQIDAGKASLSIVNQFTIDKTVLNLITACN
jgi:glycosyltransferase involved in cell wall biosynthesis